MRASIREWLKQQLELEQLLAERFDGRDRYLSQLIKYHQDLDFVGIPELRDRQALRIKDIFIHLQAEPEQEFTFQDTDIRLIDEAHSSSVMVRFTEDVDLVASIDRPGYAQYRVKLGRQRAAVREVLAQHKRIVVLGDPGAGKTTLLKYITLLFAQGQGQRLGVDEERLPVFVRLNNFVARQDERQDDYSLVEYLYTQARENLQLKLEPGFFERALERGDCIVCLDGLDELGEAGVRRELTSAVAALAHAMWSEIQPHLHDPHWREVILLLLGSLNKFEEHPTALVQHIYETSDAYEPMLHRHLFLAARALADRVEVDAKLRDQIVDELLKIVRSDEVAQYDALAVLGLLEGNERAAVGLLALAREAGVDAFVRSAAGQALGQLGRAEEAAEILLALARDAGVNALVGRAAVQALGQLGRADEAVLSALLVLARDAGVHAGVRRAAQALGQLGRADEAVLSALLVLARDAGVDDWVRREAYESLKALLGGEALAK